MIRLRWVSFTQKFCLSRPLCQWDTMADKNFTHLGIGFEPCKQLTSATTKVCGGMEFQYNRQIVKAINCTKKTQIQILSRLDFSAYSTIIEGLAL